MLLADGQWEFFFVALLVTLLGLFYVSKAIGFKAYVIVLVLSTLGYWNSYKILQPKINNDHILQLPLERVFKLEGRTFRPSDPGPKMTSIYLEVRKAFINNKWMRAKGKVKLSYRGKLELNKGSLIRVNVKLKKPTGYLNPGSFQYPEYLRKQGILVTGTALSPPEILKSSRGIVPFLRGRYLNVLSYASPKTKGILKALILGQRGEIPQEVRELFQITGVSHILAVSGVHVSVLFLFLRWFIKILSKWLQITIDKNLPTLLSLPIIWGYILLIGGPPSALRAGLMFTTVALLILFYRPFSLLNNLFIAAFFILLIYPASLWSPSFQLSFAATSGILLFVPKISGFVDRLFVKSLTPPKENKNVFGKTIKWFISIVFISIAAQIFTFPFLVAYFNCISLIGPIANVVAVPIICGFVLPICFLSFVFSLFSIYIAKSFMELASIGVEVALYILKQFAKVPYSSIWVFSFGNLEYVAFYLTIILTFVFLRGGNYKWFFITLISLLWAFYAFSLLEKRKTISDLQVTFLDVGHGDACFIRLPLGSTMLIDGGPAGDDFDAGRYVVAPFLWSQKILKVDYIVLSHPEPDHYGGLLFILKNFKPKEFWYATDWLPYELTKLLDGLKKQGLVVRKLKRGDIIRVSGVDFYVLHPPEAWSSNPNDSSLVLRVEKDKRSILFTGDISKNTEIEILKSVDELKAEVIKVPHHGSKYSSSYTFCQEVSPKIAVFSVGKHNPYGHPSVRIIKRYEGLGAIVLRTDICGAITLTANPNGWKISTYSKCSLYP